MKKAKSAAQVTQFEQIINIGPAFAKDFQILGIRSPQDLAGQNPVELYTTLCVKTKTFHDPCVLDTLMAVVDFMDGGKPKKWFKFTKARKQRHTSVVDELRDKFPRCP